MSIIGLIGIVALVLGIFHFTNPEMICRLDGIGKKIVISMETMVKKHPKRLGVFYILASILLIYVGFFRK